MRDRLDELGDAAVAVVFFDSTDRLGDYRRSFDVPEEIALLADPDRAAYRALGVGRGAWWRVWGPRTVLAYLRILGRGGSYHRHGSGSDTLQLGGDFVVGPDGTMAYAFHPPEPDARPPVDDLVEAVTRASGGTSG